MSYLAIILAAGKATRMGGKINKAFAEIGREKLIIHLINSVLESKPSKILCVIKVIAFSKLLMHSSRPAIEKLKLNFHHGV